MSGKEAPKKLTEELPKRRRLRTRDEFQKVYAAGHRYDGRLMAAFLRQNDLGEHRVGVTASTKAIGKSVYRNRAKRFLRELFRRNAAELSRLNGTYDWVLNAKRPLIDSSDELRLGDFRKILEQVAGAERRIARGTSPTNRVPHAGSPRGEVERQGSND